MCNNTVFRNYIQHLMEIHLVSDSHHYYSRAYVTCDATMFGHVAGKSRSSLMHRFTVICLKGEFRDFRLLPNTKDNSKKELLQ